MRRTILAGIFLGFFGVFFRHFGVFWGFLYMIFNLVGGKSPINQILAYNVSNRFFNLFFWGFFYIALCSILNPENNDFFRSFSIFLKISPYINQKKNAQNTPTALEGKWTETHVLGKILLPPWAILDITKMSKIDDPPIGYYKVRDRQSISEQIQSHFLKQVDNFCDWPVTKQPRN